MKNRQNFLKKFEIRHSHVPRFNEECGVFGISGTKDAAALTALGLHALQHRGQEGCGIVSYDGNSYHSERKFGLVGDIFTKKHSLEKLKGNLNTKITEFNITLTTTIKEIKAYKAELEELKTKEVAYKQTIEKGDAILEKVRYNHPMCQKYNGPNHILEFC